MQYWIATRLGSWKLTNEDPREPARWVLVVAGDRIVGPDDTVKGTDREGPPISLTVCFEVFPWMEDPRRTPEEIRAAKAFLQIDERAAKEAATRSQRREEATENLKEAMITGDDFATRFYEGELRVLDLDDADDLISDLYAAEAADDQEELHRILSSISEIFTRADEVLLARIQKKLGAERVAQYGFTR
jgi:hypothetical protein